MTDPSRRADRAADGAVDAESATDRSDDEGSVSFQRLWRLVRPYRKPVYVATALMWIGSGFGLLVPWLAGRVVDVALIDQSVGQLRQVVGGLLILFAVLGVLGAIENYLLASAGARLMRGLRQRVFDHLLALSPAFFSERRVGELLSRLASDLTALRSALTQQIPSGAQAGVRFVATLGLLLWLQTRLTAVALLVVPPVVILARLLGRRLERLSTAETDAAAAASAFAEESLAGVRTVQSFGFEGRARGRYLRELDGLLDRQLRTAKLSSIFSGSMVFAGFSAFGLVLGYGGQLMIAGELTAGELTAFLLYTFGIATSVGQLGGLYAAYRQLRGSSRRVFDLLDEESAVVEPDDPVPVDSSSRLDLRVAGVSFSYPGQDQRALDSFDLEVGPGDVLGLVGPSGGGKSTVFALLQRFYDPQQGTVRLGGTDLRELALDDLRSRIALVPQDIFLFSGSVEFNLRLARADASPEEIREAARSAGAHEFVERLPEGYDTQVGERGVKLSAGQRQRLAIARAFLADRPILLLDEATSSLDPDSEAHVQSALERLVQGRATVVIAHRLATAKKADRLLVLDAGRVVASGTHAELLESSALYRRYWTLQSLDGQSSRRVSSDEVETVSEPA